jgi:hypothetical protein
VLFSPLTAGDDPALGCPVSNRLIGWIVICYRSCAITKAAAVAATALQQQCRDT